jgi:hypothetical protein
MVIEGQGKLQETFRRLARENSQRRPVAALKSFLSAGTAHATTFRMERIRIEQHSWTGTLWAFGWLFTIGYLHLAFWKGVLAILLWPYYLGLAFAAIAH